MSTGAEESPQGLWTDPKATHKVGKGFDIEERSISIVRNDAVRARLKEAAQDHPELLEYLESKRNESEGFEELYQFVVGDDQSWAQEIKHDAETSTQKGTRKFLEQAVNPDLRAASDYDIQSRLQASLKNENGVFSQAVAISQGAVNANFDFLFKLNPDLQKIQLENRVGEMDAKLKSPLVSFQVEGSNLGMVTYYCNFVSGSVKVWDDAANDWAAPVDMTNWQFVFGVNLDRLAVEPGTDEYEKVASAIHNPGDYSISRLYMDFNSAEISNFREDLSNFQGYEWPSQGQKSYFLALMLNWANIMKSTENVEQTIVGYTLTTDIPATVNPQAPTFPPTALRFQTYPYLGQGQTQPREGIDEDGNKNMLIYLEMTNNEPFPTSKYLNYTGNWVIPGLDMDGTMAISKKVFWDSYLLRSTQPVLLTRLNEVTHARAVSASTSYSGFTADFSYSTIAGKDSSQSSSFYNWVPGSDGLSWTWGASNSKSDSAGWNSVFGTAISVNASTSNTMKIQPGSNVIRISGSSVLHVKFNTYTFGIAEGGEASATMNWELNTTLDSVYEGGLEINLNLPAQSSDVWKISTYQDSWPFGHEGDAKKLEGQLSGAVQNNQLATTSQNLQTALRSTAKFFLPGAGNFFFKNPIFNNHGDMLLQVKYDGVSDFLGRKPRSSNDSAGVAN